MPFIFNDEQWKWVQEGETYNAKEFAVVRRVYVTVPIKIDSMPYFVSIFCRLRIQKMC